MATDNPQKALLHGTLDTLILRTLAAGPRHGYGIATDIEDRSGEAVLIEDGSLYPALYRLEHQGLIDAEWGDSDNNRKAKYYTLTTAGRRRLKEETASWNQLTSAVASVLDATAEEI